MARVTVIGKNSFLAKHLAQENPDWTYLSHEQALSDNDWVKKTDTLINCAFHPDLRNGDYSPIKDIDFMLAGYCAHHPVHYIMLSSRAVYGEAPKDKPLLKEVHIPKPQSTYGQNKLLSEQALADILPPERLSILRSGNIFGAEYGRATFFGLMLSSLKDKGVLRFNIAPDAVRDFLSAKAWAQAVTKIAANPKGGLYNLASGFGTTTQDIAELLVQYHGSGEIEYTDHLYNGQFILDMTKTRKTFGLARYTRDMLEEDVKAALS